MHKIAGTYDINILQCLVVQHTAFRCAKLLRKKKKNWDLELFCWNYFHIREISKISFELYSFWLVSGGENMVQ